MDKKTENNPSNLWTRRSKTSHADTPDDRSTPTAKRYNGKSNPLGTPLAAASIASPTTAGASSAFGLGSGAFASFGAAPAAKTPKTPGSSAFDFGKTNSAGAIDRKQDANSSTTSEEKEASDKDTAPRRPTARKSVSSIKTPAPSNLADQGLGSATKETQAWPLKHSWVIYYRPPTGKNTDYEKSIKPLCRMTSVQDFWAVYAHLRRPSTLPTVSDYHFFRSGIRPVWEDDSNKSGGKWIMRLKKGVADRYWEDLLLAIIGDQFGEASDEVCGVVISVRQGEDVFSLWTKNDGGRNVKIRETVKRCLNLPADTEVLWRSHGESIVLKTESEKERERKMDQKRRGTVGKESKITSGEEES
ncbi:hypothetical protein LTR62_000546 [Meristemomyces frigidus]|uniref:IF4E-domain-containing protein n=1 Tax=Meristemomyces frigidus TaxID=1508187 RepID=A0AAN7TAB9_9PEZI|nr:hypothetical protein LTR62_000546 [Meristemomyces frigidus]